MSYFSLGDEEALTRDAAEMLRALSFYLDDKALRITPDGVYSEEMRSAVAHFQSLYGLPVTGRLDYESHALLYKESSLVREAASIPSVSVFPPGRKDPISRGERSDTVLLLQLILSSLRQNYDFRERIPLSGVYDSMTESAVREMERRYGLAETGEVGDVLLKRLVNDYNRTLARGE